MSSPVTGRKPAAAPTRLCLISAWRELPDPDERVSLP